MERARQLAVSPDGRTIAVFGTRKNEPVGTTVVTVDADSGERLGEYTYGGVHATGLAWTASGELLVRTAQAGREQRSNVRAFDRTLTERDAWPSVADDPIGRFTAVGDAAVVYGYGSRPTATPQTGVPVVADSLRLVAAEHLVALPDRSFGSGDVAGPSEDVAAADDASLDAGLLTALGIAAAAAGVSAAMVVGRRRTRA